MKPAPNAKVVATYPWGLPGTVDDPRSTMFRPLKALMDQGRPPGILAYAYLAPIWEAHPDITPGQLAALVNPDDPATWVHMLGAFCHTAGDRLLFAPGW